MQQSTVEGSGVFKADFDFRWVDVDIDGFRVDLHMKETDGQATDHQEPTVSFSESVLQCAISDVSAVEEKILHSVVAARDRWICYVASHFDFVVFMFYSDQSISDFIPEECSDSLRPTGCWWKVMQGSLVACEDHMDIWKSQRDSREGFHDMSHFRRRCLEELSANGSVEEQMAYFECCTDIHRTRFDRFTIRALSAKFVAAVRGSNSAAQSQVADLSDRCESFTTKS
jgi:hypothetical protein